MDYQKLLGNKIDRRRLLGNLGMMGAGAVITACGAGAVAPPVEPVEPSTDLDPVILNFALNLEYLEAAFYLAAVGRLDELTAADGGTATIALPDGFDGNEGIAFTDDDANIEAYANEIATNELAHVVFLRTALAAAGAPVADRPALDLGPAFQAAAGAAFPSLGAEVTDAFNPFANSLFFLHGAFIFEDVGVTAYSGAAPAITSAAFLAPAAGILSVEAYHAGQIRTLLYAARETETPFGGATVAQVVAGISALRATVGGGKDEGIVNEDGSANINPTNDDGIAYARTPREVANIVYLGIDATSGGFYPSGITVPAGLEDGFAALLAL